MAALETGPVVTLNNTLIYYLTASIAFSPEAVGHIPFATVYKSSFNPFEPTHMLTSKSIYDPENQAPEVPTSLLGKIYDLLVAATMGTGHIGYQ
jgi:hypothetical protein